MSLRLPLSAFNRYIARSTSRPIFPISKSHFHTTALKMSTFKQVDHKLLVIPGPIEFSDPVLAANATPGTSHVAPNFIPVFGDCLRMLKEVLYATKRSDNQSILVAGSGTMGWDMAGTNLIQEGDEAVVLHTGYFGSSFTDCLQCYGAKVNEIKAEIGGVPSDDSIVKALQSKPKLITITAVDTSTGVLSPIEHIAGLVKKHSPDTLILVDAVCAVASEEIRFDDWGLDMVITATQKGLGAPPGLSVVLASGRAIKTYENRKAQPPGYYLSWKNWLPVMKAYEAGKPSYFATPPVQLIYSFHVALTEILKQGPSLEERFDLHKAASKKIKDGVEGLGFGFVPLDRKNAANGMTAVRFPKGLTAADIVPKLAEKGIVVAGGLHKAIATEYFRIGHMGITAVDQSRGDLDKILNGIKEVLNEKGWKKN